MMNGEQQASLDWDISDIIQMLAKYLPEEEKSQALDRARSLVTPDAKVGALVGLADILSAPLRDSVRKEALQIARSIEMPWYRFRAMTDVLYVSDKAQQNAILEDLLPFLTDISGAWNQRRALFLISSFLSTDLADKAVLLAKSFEDDGIRVQTLARLSSHLSNREKLEVLDELQTLYEDETGQSLVSSLLNLMGNLPPGSKSHSLKHVDHVTQPGARIQLLTNLINHFPDQKEEFLGQLSEILMSNKGDPYHFWNLLMVAGVAPEPQRGQWIKEAQSLAMELDGQFKVRYLAQVAKYLAEEEKTIVIDDAIESARGIEDPVFRAKSLGILLSDMPDHLRSPIAREAWTALTAGDSIYIG